MKCPLCKFEIRLPILIQSPEGDYLSAKRQMGLGCKGDDMAEVRACPRCGVIFLKSHLVNE